MSRRIITALSCGALAVGGAFVAGCGNDSNDTGSTQSTPATAPAASQGATIEVSMKDSKFLPEQITAKVGQKITWTNDDGYAHNVTAVKGADFRSDNFDGGGTYEYTPAKAGTIDYVCTIHSGQRGTITVTK
jgi:plastocyanin